jgi:hypothetical protein
MTILIIGNSGHLYEAISKAYPDQETRVIPWRSDFNNIERTYFDLVFVVGFDYSSYTSRYKDYMDVNVFHPILAVQRFAKPTADKVYVTTQDEHKRYTFSRYRYAKEILGLKLVTLWPNSYVVRFDTFATDTNKPLVKGSLITKLIFKCLVRIGVTKTIDMPTVSDRLRTYKLSSSNEMTETKGLLLTIPRPQFIDRMLRILIA